MEKEVLKLSSPYPVDIYVLRQHRTVLSMEAMYIFTSRVFFSYVHKPLPAYLHPLDYRFENF
jgi:hypothetical protein